MSTLDASAVMSSRGWIHHQTTAAPDEVLARPAQRNERAEWNRVVDVLLSWIAYPSLACCDEVPEPDSTLLESSLDFAYDCRRSGRIRAPDSIAPNLDSGVSFEWRNGESLSLVEIALVGTAEVTHFSGREVIDHYLLRRDPTTRRLERESI